MTTKSKKGVAGLLGLVALTLAGCGDARDTAIVDAPAVSVSDSDLARICRAAIAAIMGRDVSIIGSVSVEDGIALNEYRRPGDASLWRNQCRLDGNRVIWAGMDVDGPGSGPGRWRDHPDDEMVTYEMLGNSITITQTFSDGSAIVETMEVV